MIDFFSKQLADEIFFSKQLTHDFLWRGVLGGGRGTIYIHILLSYRRPGALTCIHTRLLVTHIF